MGKLNVVHTLYSGLGGHANVVFPLLETTFGETYHNHLTFFGVEPVVDDYIAQANELAISHLSLVKKPKRYRAPLATFLNYLKKHKADVVFVHSSELLLAALWYRRKKTNCQVYYVEHENNSTKGRMLNWLSRQALKRANGVVCLNAHYKTELLGKYVCKSPITVIPNGINTEKYKRTRAVSPHPTRIGMASRMIPGKDHPTLFKAFAQLKKEYPNLELHIAGDGPTLEQVKELAKTMQIDTAVKFYGLLNAKAMRTFYNDLDIYVQATHAETLSTSILQAMAFELPVITTAIDNNKVLIEHEQTGWLYTDKNTDELVTCIRLILNQPEAALNIAKNGRQMVERDYSNKAMATAYAQLIQFPQ